MPSIKGGVKRKLVHVKSTDNYGAASPKLTENQTYKLLEKADNYATIRDNLSHPSPKIIKSKYDFFHPGDMTK